MNATALNAAGARSLLFVPATRPERIGKALAAGADITIIDLEDAVAPEDKDAARGALAGVAHRAAVRINACGTPWFDADLAACGAARVPLILLPKAEQPAHVQRVRDVLGDSAVIAIVETAAGFEGIGAVARSPGVVRLAFGSLDLQAELGIDDAGEPLHYFRSKLVLASRLGGLGAPIDGVCTALDDAAALDDRAAKFSHGYVVVAIAIAGDNAFGEWFLYFYSIDVSRGINEQEVYLPILVHQVVTDRCFRECANIFWIEKLENLQNL